MANPPKLTRETHNGISVLTDPGARAAGVLVAFTDRRGGASSSPYDELNLATRVGDDLNDVAKNRERVAAALDFSPDRLVLSKQVHGRDVARIGKDARGVVGEADGLLVTTPGPVVAILTADCAPVVIAGERGAAVLHAGWRGLVGGVVQAGVEMLGDVRAAWVGPSIKSCCYEVGPEVVDAFSNAGLPVAAPRRVDVQDAAAAALRNAGVDAVTTSDICTHTDHDYFSFRRDGVTGRQGAFVALIE